MKNYLYSLGQKVLTTALLCGGMFLTATAIEAQNPKPFVIPEIQQWTGHEGSISIKRIVATRATENVAKQFAADWKEMFHQDIPVVSGSKAQAGDLLLAIGKKVKDGSEAYDITIAATGSTLYSRTPTALYWGTRTLLQIAEQNATHTLPCGIIHDAPQYAMRGFMIDCGRKFFPLSYLRDLAKCMSYYKMNTLQIHLNDNGFKQYFGGKWENTQAAFRMESTLFPELTAKDGSYGKEEFRQFQLEAAKMGVEIIPEIDVPAHSLAFSHFRPSLGSKEFGMDHLDLFNPDLYPFLDSLFAEYLGGPKPVFVGPRVNIGTDEYSSARQDVVEKFRELTDHYLKLVQSYGKQAACWGALTHAKGKTPVTNKNVIMNCWYNGYAEPDSMKTLGYKLVSIPDGFVYIVPAAGYYYDYLNTHYLYDSWTPAQIGGKKFEEQDPSILGGMFAVWNDHPGNGITIRDVHDRVMPALQTLAVKCWRGAQTSTPWETFDKNRHQLSEAPGVNLLGRFHVPPYNMWVQPGDDIEVLRLSNLKDAAKLTHDRFAGFGYEISFHLDGANEERGTILTQGGGITVYLSDPQTGRLGFEQEGYYNTFNYTCRPGCSDDITIRCKNNETILLVNGKERDRLNRLTLYTTTDKGANPYNQQCKQMWTPSVFPASNKSVMYLQRTLIFPLETIGNYNSNITNVVVRTIK